MLGCIGVKPRGSGIKLPNRPEFPRQETNPLREPSTAFDRRTIQACRAKQKLDAGEGRLKIESLKRGNFTPDAGDHS